MFIDTKQYISAQLVGNVLVIVTLIASDIPGEPVQLSTYEMKSSC